MDSKQLSAKLATIPNPTTWIPKAYPQSTMEEPGREPYLRRRHFLEHLRQRGSGAGCRVPVGHGKRLVQDHVWPLATFLDQVFDEMLYLTAVGMALLASQSLVYDRRRGVGQLGRELGRPLIRRLMLQFRDKVLRLCSFGILRHSFRDQLVPRGLGIRLLLRPPRLNRRE